MSSGEIKIRSYILTKYIDVPHFGSPPYWDSSIVSLTCSSSRLKKNYSVTLARHGVREIGLKSSHDLGGFTLGIARMWAF